MISLGGYSAQAVKAGSPGAPPNPIEPCYWPDCSRIADYQVLDGAKTVGYFCRIHANQTILALASRNNPKLYGGPSKEATADMGLKREFATGLMKDMLADMLAGAEFPVRDFSPEMSEAEVAEGMRRIEAIRQTRRDAGSGDVELYRRNGKYRRGNGKGH